MFECLVDDLVAIQNRIQQDQAVVWRRAFCRALFAMIEGINSWLKQYVVKFWPGIIGDDTKLALQDRKIVTNKSGNQNIALAYKPFAENLYFSFDTFAWTSGSDFCLNRKSEGWVLLNQANIVRNRVVHPKRPDDLNITDAELALLQRTFNCYIEQLLQLFRSSGQALMEETEGLKRAWCKYHPDQADLADTMDQELEELHPH